MINLTDKFRHRSEVLILISNQENIISAFKVNRIIKKQQFKNNAQDDNDNNNNNNNNNNNKAIK